MKISSSKVQKRPLRISREDGSYQVSVGALRDNYLAALEDKLELSEGEKNELSSLQNQSLVVAYAVASQLLGPSQAIALAGTAMAALASAQDRQDADAGMLARLKAKKLGTAGGTEISIYAGEGVGFGASTALSVVIPDVFAQTLQNAAGAFILGHELGHVEEDDIIQGMGRSFLANRLKDSPYAEEAMAALEDCQHDMELRADKHGIAYGLERGFSKQGLREAADLVFKISGSDPSDSHPGREERLAHIDEILAS